ncbi:MAG: alpha/beta fold hydrolase [Leptolyngbyaceae bacterium]|nr:alpha/beta fold hydrolase [Leptolyngbyaceae bacterium]
MAIAPSATLEQTLTVGKLGWFYREAVPEKPNNRPPVICLHGIPAQSYSWRKVLPELAAQGFRAIAPDWIGMGFSDTPEKFEFAYTPDAYVNALNEFLEALEIPTVSLVVQGFLGSVGLQYAFRHPDKVERLAVLNAPISSSAKLPWRMKQLGIPLVGEMLTQDPLLVDRTLEGGGPYEVDDEDLDVYRRPFLRSSSAGRSLFFAVRNLQLAKSLAEIETGFSQWEKPTLVAWGTSDPWLPVELAETLAAQLADADLVKLDEVGHYAQEDWPEKVTEALIPFLRRQAL